ncbi:hypothetical protein [Paenibacillus aceti]|uniref:hypothetical protein n=1 Tax=Paenibacillus aceti TaxID=1820010 RepID=UPI000EA09CA1|nr:hypothetical protein [Paenibacillus aceti]
MSMLNQLERELEHIDQECSVFYESTSGMINEDQPIPDLHKIKGYDLLKKRYECKRTIKLICLAKISHCLRD